MALWSSKPTVVEVAAEQANTSQGFFGSITSWFSGFKGTLMDTFIPKMARDGITSYVVDRAAKNLLTSKYIFSSMLDRVMASARNVSKPQPNVEYVVDLSVLSGIIRDTTNALSTEEFKALPEDMKITAVAETIAKNLDGKLLSDLAVFYRVATLGLQGKVSKVFYQFEE